jgi:glycosyltransferase involved in cell wall biosynthesis
MKIPMNKTPLASCICVTYNRPHLLNELLYCFLNQDYENKELIIINDQSTVEYSYDDSRIKIYNIIERFPSLGAKRNYSRNLFNGDFVFYMDDDDIYYSNHISKLINIHQNNLDYDIILNTTRHNSFNNENVNIGTNDLVLNGASVKAEYVKNNYFPHYVSCFEDVIFVENADTLKIYNEEHTFNYRLGFDIWHVSNMGGNGIETYDVAAKFKVNDEFRKIILIPELSEKTKLYYK